MALQVICENGHSFVAADIYENWPKGAPYCPVCYLDWAKLNGAEIPARMKEEADEVLEYTEKMIAYAKRREEQEQALAEHRKVHEFMTSNFCPDCGERLR